MPGRPGRFQATLTRSVAPGVHRLAHAGVNCYLVEDRRAITVVDAALPATWTYLRKALTVLSRGPSDVAALVLTHAHFDHLGFAKRMVDEWGVPVLAHPEERTIAAHPYRYAHENPRALYPLRHPGGVPILTAMARAGAFAVPGIEEFAPFTAGDRLDVPGRPTVVFTPGHTFGHSALLLEDSGALLVGDALVTLDPYTGFTGPRIVAGAATADSAQALASLQVIADTDADVLLPGHGEPGRTGAASAAATARANGAS